MHPNQAIDVWNGGAWVAGNKLEVYEHDGIIISYTMGDYSVDEYVLEVPVSSGTVFGGGLSFDPYVIRDPGKVIAGEQGNIDINNINITDPTLPYTVTEEAFVVMDIDAPSTYQFTMNLDVGYNLISFPISHCFYEGQPPANQPDCVEFVNIADLGYSTMAGWLNSVLTPNNPVGSAWRIVVGANGAMDSTIGSQFHSLKYMSPSEGYWVKITEEADGAVLVLDGPLFDTDCVIDLPEGWSLVGYPRMVGYYDTASPPAIDAPEGTTWVKVNAPVAEYVFESIDDSYRIIIGENGAYDPNIGPEFSSLHYVAPGSAFWIKMDNVAALQYPGE